MHFLRLLALCAAALAAPAPAPAPAPQANDPPATPGPSSSYAYYGITPTEVTFSSSSTPIVGYHYAPANSSSSSSSSVPVVLVAHGLGGLQTSRIQPFAAKFASLGYHALTFDYRHWGFSAGTPRNLIDVGSQQADYEAAAAFAGTLPGVDAGRVVLWGTSLSGGHVLQLAGQGKVPGQVATIAQCPHVNGPYTVSLLPPASLPGLIAAGAADDTGAGVGAVVPPLASPPLYIPLANHTGQFGALTQPDAYSGYQFVQASPPPPGNVFPARFVTELPFFSPDAYAASSKLPTFLAIGATDDIVGTEAQTALAKRMEDVEFHTYQGGHFSVYYGADQYEAILADQVAFLQKNVPL